MTNRTRFVGPFTQRPPCTGIAVLGFTSHHTLAPYDDPSFEIFGVNDLYYELGQVFQRKDGGAIHQRVRWFQLHNWVELQEHRAPTGGELMHPGQGPPHPRDPNHLLWLKEASKHFPVYLREAHDQLPDCLAYPRAECYEYFKDGRGRPIKYFTNTISWMIALAIMELVPEPGGRCIPGAKLGVYGVDMMQAGESGSEYGYQRPSVEWLLGWASGAGVEIYVPDESDILKSAYQYGDEEEFYFRTRVQAYKADLEQQRVSAANQRFAASEHERRMEGAKSALEWVQRSHMPGDDGSRQARAPLENANKEMTILWPTEPVEEKEAWQETEAG